MHRDLSAHDISLLMTALQTSSVDVLRELATKEGTAKAGTVQPKRRQTTTRQVKQCFILSLIELYRNMNDSVLGATDSPSSQ